MKDLYERKAEEIFRRGDEILKARKKRKAIIERSIFTVSGLCAATAISFGILHDTILKNAVKREEPFISTPNDIIAETTEFSGNTHTTTATEAVTDSQETEIVNTDSESSVTTKAEESRPSAETQVTTESHNEAVTTVISSISVTKHTTVKSSVVETTMNTSLVPPSNPTDIEASVTESVTENNTSEITTKIEQDEPCITRPVTTKQTIQTTVAENTEPDYPEIMHPPSTTVTPYRPIQTTACEADESPTPATTRPTSTEAAATPQDTTPIHTTIEAIGYPEITTVSPHPTKNYSYTFTINGKVYKSDRIVYSIKNCKYDCSVTVKRITSDGIDFYYDCMAYKSSYDSSEDEYYVYIEDYDRNICFYVVMYEQN